MTSLIQFANTITCTNLVSEVVRWIGLAKSGWSKLNMALSSSSEVVGALKEALVVGVVDEVGVVVEVDVADRAEGEEGRRLSRGSEPFVLILQKIDYEDLFSKQYSKS